MKTVVFENKGSIDLRAITTFGMSVKETNNPIGYFGTGLKYAIAICMREKINIEMVVDGEKYKFKTQEETVRGKDFQVVSMNNTLLPFTTHLGANWELWQAFREIYCNCIDEGGKVYLNEPETFDEEKTYFIVRDERFAHLFHERDTIVLNLSDKLKLDSKSQLVDIYKVKSDFLYYRGIRVKKLEYPAAYTYNLKMQTELTEDRTLRWSNAADTPIMKTIGGLLDKDEIRKFILAPDHTYEGNISYMGLKFYMEDISEQFNEVVEKEFRKNSEALNQSCREYMKDLMKKSASRFYEDAEMTAVEAKIFYRACELIPKAFPDFDMYRIRVVKNLGERTMGLADHKEGMIVISQKCFNFGTKYVMSTLIEEYLHLKTGYRDCTRELQTHLFDTICTLMENHVIMEPI